MRPLIGLLLVAFLLQALPASRAARAAEPEHRVDAKFLAGTAAVAPGKPFTLGVLLKIQPGWHVYWKNPGDSGIATTVDFTVPAGFTVGELQFPVPHRLDLPGGIVSFGYEDQVMLLATVTPPKDLQPGANVRIGAKVNWLVCQENCFPGDADLLVDLPTSADAQPQNQELFHAWRARVPMAAKPEDVTVDGDAKQMNLAVKTPPGVKDVEWFPPATESETIRDVKVTPSNDRVEIHFSVVRPPGQKPSDQTLQSVLSFVTPDGKRTGLLVPFQWRH